NLALTVSVIVAVIFGMIQVKMSNRDRRERLTLETLRNFQTREFAELIHYTTSVEFPKDYEEWQKWPDENRIRNIQFMQEMEALGMLLAEKLINIELIDKTLGSFVISSWEKFKPLVLQIRERSQDPFLAEYYQWMARQMDERLKKNLRQPFYVSSN
ncbi:MAG TPA: hypothetical protein VJ508_19845, partial [Saprospiraceae bacterium]|nr:hypothetical protein [Saprospiraceae bacterium]